MIDSTAATIADADALARPLVEVEHLSIRFPIGRSGFWGGQVRYVHAVDDVSVTIGKGETLGLVGESGSGKTTFGRALLRRIQPTEGTIRFRRSRHHQRARRRTAQRCAATCSSCSRTRTRASTRG